MAELWAQAAEQHRRGQLDAAEASYREILRFEPRHAEASLQLGILLRERGDVVAAARSLSRAARLHPGDAAIHFEIGSLLESLAQHDRALTHYKRALAIEPGHVQALIRGGDCWLSLASADRACLWYQRALEVAPASMSARNNLGSVYQAQGKLEDALREYRHVLAEHPAAFETRVNLATALHELGDTTAALVEIRSALLLRPQDAKALTNLGVLHEDLGEHELALATYERALAANPQDADAHLHRALLLVQQERFAEGWDEYEWRFATRTNQRARRFACPAWEGSSLASQHLFVHAEQGIGDEIMFATCLPEIIARAKHVTLTCDRRLATLFQRSFPRATVFGVERGGEPWRELAADADCHVPAGSLPRFVRRSERDFPRRGALLMADAARVEHWKARLQELGPGLKVGISWRGGADSKLLDGAGQGAGYRACARRRSCLLGQWSELLAVPNVCFVNLQYKATRQEFEQLPAEIRRRIYSFDEVDLRNDIDELAALASSLDLMISVGNATVHLAGAVGTPTWALLPRHWGWRWLGDRSDCLWYPRVRLWRQRTDGDWPELLGRVQGALAALSAQRRLALPSAEARLPRCPAGLSVSSSQPARTAKIS
ncbi:MAG: tetratricopeptide repeat protein [Pirellulales bacterium]|nr:tetratricopeptide repeat protein [Pirellulales bacterium]